MSDRDRVSERPHTSERISASDNSRTSKPEQTAGRRIARVVLTLIGLAGVIVLPVLTWQCYAPGDAEPGATESAPRSVERPSFSGLQDTLLEAYLQVQGEDAQAPVSDDPTPVTFTIVPGETAAQIAQRLESEGLIRDANLFKVLLRVRGMDTRLEAGDYQLRRDMSMAQIMDTLQNGRPPTVVLTIPEGWRAEQIADLLAARQVANPDRFLELVRAGAGFDPATRPEGATSLEGFLFPDTYEFNSDATSADVVERMLATFEARFTPEMRRQAEAHGLTVYEAVTLASIIEREARVPDERRLISGVFHNRLEAGMHLNADPTVQYALGYQDGAGEWWKRPLYLEDLDVDSSYNTYLYVGLPPGPICNPGLAALQAAVEPADTNYFYFVANDVAGDGSHVFSETLEEHNANIEKYRR